MMSHRESVKGRSQSSTYLRSKRVEESASIRKKKREGLLSGRRIKETSEESLMDHKMGDQIDLHECVKCIQASYPKDTEKMKSSLMKLSHHFMQVYLEKDDNGGSLDEKTTFSIVKALQLSLSCSEFDVKFNALWCLTNMAAATPFGDSFNELIPEMVLCLDSQNERLIEQVSWALGNMSADNIDVRKRVIAAGGLLPTIRALKQSSLTEEAIQNVCFCLANLLKGNEPPVIEAVRFGILEALKIHSQNENPMVLSGIAWVMVFLTSKADRFTEVLLQDNYIPTFLAIPAIRAIGNLVCAVPGFTPVLLSSFPIVDPMISFLKSHSRPLRKETLWLVSNLTTEPVFLNYVTPDLIECLTYAIHNETFDLKREAGYSIMNIYSSGNTALCDYIDSWDAVLGFTDFLQSQECELMELGLFYFQKFLELKGHDALVKMQEASNLVETLESLSYNDNEVIRGISFSILETLERLDEENQ